MVNNYQWVRTNAIKLFCLLITLTSFHISRRMTSIVNDDPSSYVEVDKLIFLTMGFRKLDHSVRPFVSFAHESFVFIS